MGPFGAGIGIIFAEELILTWFGLNEVFEDPELMLIELGLNPELGTTTFGLKDELAVPVWVFEVVEETDAVDEVDVGIFPIVLFVLGVLGL